MRRIRPDDSGQDNWLTTYSDLVTLLLCFFVMLFSMSVLNQEKFYHISKLIQQSFLKSYIESGDIYFDNDGNQLINMLEGQMEDNTISSSTDYSSVIGLTFEQIKKEINNTVDDMNLHEYVTVIDEEYRIILRLNALILFDMGSAEIKQEGMDTIIKLGDILAEYDHEIVVNGHTCDLPINTLLYPTNWELSTKRATNVARTLIEKCGIDPSRVSAVGHAEFKPLKPNTSEENRKMNRRIEIYVEKKSNSN